MCVNIILGKILGSILNTKPFPFLRDTDVLNKCHPGFSPDYQTRLYTAHSDQLKLKQMFL